MHSSHWNNIRSEEHVRLAALESEDFGEWMRCYRQSQRKQNKPEKEVRDKARQLQKRVLALRRRT